MNVADLRRIAQDLSLMHDLDARVIAIYEAGQMEERGRVTAALRKLANDAGPRPVTVAELAAAVELPRAANQVSGARLA